MKRLMYSSVGLLFIVIVFLGFNLLSNHWFKNTQIDFTEQKLYTLSDGTRQLLLELQEPIRLQYFYSDKATRDVPTLRNYARRVEELLGTYVRMAEGKLSLEVIDPEPFSEAEDRAAALGLQAIPLDQGGAQLYFGLAAENNQGDQYIIPFFTLDQEALLEYELSRLISSVAQPERPVIGLLSGLPLNGGFDMQAGRALPVWTILEEVRQQFHIESLADDVDLIPEEVDTLFLVHPKNLSQATKYAIDQFVLRGGKLLAFVDPFSEADIGGIMLGAAGMDKESNLPTLFQAWGLRMVPEQVVGDGAYAMSVGVGPEQRAVRHPGWLELPQQALNDTDVLTSQLNNVTLASAGILEPLADATTQFTPLLYSSEYAMPFAAQRMAMLQNPAQLLAELEPTGERYVLAARISGPAHSAFIDGVEGQSEGLKQADNINVIVIADSDILSDRMWVHVQNFFGQRLPQPWADNGSFTINALENLSGSDALIGIRSRGNSNRPFTVVDQLQRVAQERFLQKEQALQARLAETEDKLFALQQEMDPSQEQELTVEQEATMQQFLEQKLKIRKELREVRYQLSADIEALGTRLKFFNIGVMPILLTFMLVMMVLLRRIRRMKV
ncbi:Gldg family protein [Denitrificimonas sp. JX-1]|uniref:Gldg family protein n=1 Tax=Denitrificimonas halotolerans TaxID=3098930 RepID=A0ABU5GNT8_9GAMM|nr:Gldg family protein [Denitrificimonas sp. JX-1]MDY7218664.1 Gldg family protein [Denitrificimonas sp. JX-1]